MAYPPAYVRAYSFTDFETLNPGEPKPGDKLDTEYDAVSNALTATQNSLALIQRADGALANDSVGEDQLQDGLLDGIVDGVTADAEAAAAAAAASASAAAGSAAAADASAVDVAAQVAIAAGHAASAGVSQTVAQSASIDAADAAALADTSADVAVTAATSVENSVAQAQLHEEMAFKWAEYLAAPVMPAPPGWPEAVDDGMFSAKWWALRARDYNEVHEYDFGTAGANPGEAFDIWDLTNDLEDPPGLVYMTWGTPPHTYVLTDPSNPSDPNSWMDITGATGPMGPPGTTGATGPAGPPNTLTIGTVTTGAPGSPAAATITGTAPNQVLDMTIPAGADGAGTTLVAATGTIGLTAVAGAAATAARSDSTPPLSQAIVPTWSGAHTFNALVNLAGPVQTSGNDGVSGQVLSSQGAGLPAVWRTPGGGAIELGWNFSTAVGTANPGSQKLSLNSAVYTSVTVAVFNSLAMTNFDANTILSLLQAGNRIYIQQRNDATKAVVYQVTGPGTNQGGYWTIPVTHVNSISAVMFPANADLNAVFILSVSGSAFANPSAQVGLTVINGSAGTGMRSDAAPALNQAIAPTWTGSHLFAGAALNHTATGVGIGVDISPKLTFGLASGAANEKSWDMYASTTFGIRAVNDAATDARWGLAITRVGYAISDVSFGNASDNPTYTFLGTGLLTFRNQTIQHQQAGMSHYLEIVAGNNVNPGYIEWFNGGTRLGFIGYWNGSNKLVINADAYGWDFSGAIPPTISGQPIATFSSGQMFAPDGVVSAPAYSFAEHPGSGMWWNHAGNYLGFSANGFESITASSAGVGINVPANISGSLNVNAIGATSAAINVNAPGTKYAEFGCQLTSTEGLYIVANYSGATRAGIPTGTTGISNVVGSPLIFAVGAVEAARFTSSGGLQVTGGLGSGFRAAPGIEVAMVSTTAYLQAFNRATSAYLSMKAACTQFDIVAYDATPNAGDLWLGGKRAVTNFNDGSLYINYGGAYQAIQIAKIVTVDVADGNVTAEFRGVTGKLRFYGFSTASAYIQAHNAASSATIPLVIDSSTATFTGRAFFPTGSAAVPSITFTGASSNGFNCLSTAYFSALAGGVAVCTFMNNGGQSQVQVINGTVAAPGLCFTADNNTGWLCGGVGDLRGACSGTQVIAFAPTQITANVNVTAPSFTTSSSRAIKRETGKPSFARDILARLRPLLYRLLNGDDHEQLGLIAEEVHEVCPQLSDGKSVAYDRLAILLLAAWQDEHLEAA